jgi:hypothetical protein
MGPAKRSPPVNDPLADGGEFAEREMARQPFKGLVDHLVKIIGDSSLHRDIGGFGAFNNVE